MFWSTILTILGITLLTIIGLVGWWNASYWERKWVNLNNRLHSDDEE